MSEAGVAATPRELGVWVAEARDRSLALVADLTDAELLGPRLAIVNPLLWEIGHVAWFQERWVLREGWKRPPLREDGDRLWDSARVAHETRWDLPLPSRSATLDYVRAVRDRVLEGLETQPLGPELRDLVLLAIYHEDMHTEAFTYTRQTLGYVPPSFCDDPADLGSASGGIAPPSDDAEIAGGELELGAVPGEGFVFDNEQWAHPVRVATFRMARSPVTQGAFCEFVEDDGYARREFWSEAGWRWRESEGAEGPLYWRRDGGRWWRRRFHRWVELEPDLPAIHVNAHEAEAYCRWVGRRLPTEAEWEWAAKGSAGRRFAWGAVPPTAERARLDWTGGGTAPVGALSAGATPEGVGDLIGNVWEWTSTPFAPYPGFRPGRYREYSAPWFHTHRVLRGGCWATRGRLLRNTWRNFYEPHRRDVWAGFRTCACDPEDR